MAVIFMVCGPYLRLVAPLLLCSVGNTSTALLRLCCTYDKKPRLESARLHLLGLR